MLFKKEILLKSSYPNDKLFERLEASMQFDIKNPEKRKFRGKIDRNKNTFSIIQDASRSPRDNIKSLIIGSIKEDKENDVCFIKLSFRLPNGYTTLFIILATFNIIVAVLVYFFSTNTALRSFLPTAIPFALIGFLIISVNIFSSKTSEAIKDLSFIFGARETEETVK